MPIGDIIVLILVAMYFGWVAVRRFARTPGIVRRLMRGSRGLRRSLQPDIQSTSGRPEFARVGDPAVPSTTTPAIGIPVASTNAQSRSAIDGRGSVASTEARLKPDV